MTVDEQIAALRAMRASRAARGLPTGGLLATMGLATAGVVTGGAPWIMAALFVGAVSLLARATVPHVTRAVAGLDHGRHVDGVVRITEIQWSDSSSWEAVANGASGARWRIDFMPVGWAPRDGEHRAVLTYIDGVDWPVLARLDDGVVCPRQRPRRVLD